MKILWLILFTVLMWSIHDCFGQTEDERYTSSEENEYYKHYNGSEFKPFEKTFIESFKYDYLKIRKSRPGNEFASVLQRSRVDRHCDSLRDIFSEKIRNVNPKDSVLRKGLSASLDSLELVYMGNGIGGVTRDWVLRYDSMGSTRIILYKDPRLYDNDFSYSLSISHDSGKSWKKYDTGLIEGNFYYIKPNGRIRLFMNDSTIQVEFSMLQKTRPASRPVGSPEYKLIRDNLIMELNLRKITADRDHDGLTDILEEKLFTNPLDTDTDHDGIDDLTDKNPRHRDLICMKSSLFKYILEPPGSDSVFIPFDNVEIQYPNSSEREAEIIMIVSDDPALTGLTGTRNKYIILSTAEAKEYERKNVILLKQYDISPFFKLDRTAKKRKIHFSYVFGETELLITEDEKGFKIEVIGCTTI